METKEKTELSLGQRIVAAHKRMREDPAYRAEIEAKLYEEQSPELRQMINEVAASLEAEEKALAEGKKEG